MVSDVQRTEEIRDLRNQVSELQNMSGAERQEIIFKETSPQRQKVTIFSMRDGEPLTIPLYMWDAASKKRDRRTGEYMFTAKSELAPEYKLGTTLCFLHADSNEQMVLKEIGLDANPCRKKTLKNQHSKRMHALHRHPEEWAAYQEFVEEQTKAGDRDRQNQQLEATLALAGRAAGSAPEATPESMAAAIHDVRAQVVERKEFCDIDGCEFSPPPGPPEGIAKALAFHRRQEHAASR